MTTPQRPRPKDARFVCYPYMREAASTVDMEIRTDSLCTQIGYAAAHATEHAQLQQDLVWLMEMVYHVNGSVRGLMAISHDDLMDLSDLYDRYRLEVAERTTQFVLPQGNVLACVLHMARSDAKKSVRAMHKVSQETDVEKILFDFLGLAANTLFVMALFANQKAGVQEKIFTSKSYTVRPMGPKPDKATGPEKPI